MQDRFLHPNTYIFLMKRQNVLKGSGLVHSLFNPKLDRPILTIPKNSFFPRKSATQCNKQLNLHSIVHDLNNDPITGIVANSLLTLITR